MDGRTERYTNNEPQEQRVDLLLARFLPEFSRSKIQKLIKDGYVRVDGRTITKAGFVVGVGCHIEMMIPPPVPSQLVAEDIPLDCIFENKDVLIVNKPAGMVVHPSPGHSHGTLVHAALGRVPDLQGINGVERPGIVHRLDKDTSGLIIIAKNESSHIWLQEQFRSRKVEKEYIALVDGKPPTSSGRIDAAIGRNTTHRKLMAVVPEVKGREAVTEYHTIRNFLQHTLLSVHPLTGRTHQIRVHMAFMGCPVAGDTVYGKRKPTIDICRQFLHAHKIRINLPGESQASAFEAPLPSELEEILKILD